MRELLCTCSNTSQALTRRDAAVLGETSAPACGGGTDAAAVANWNLPL